MTTTAPIAAPLLHRIDRYRQAVAGYLATRRIADPEMVFAWPMAIGFGLLCFAINYPGRINMDPLVALYGAASPAEVGNWHAPVLAWLWDIPGSLIGQPAGALLVQSAVFAAYAGFMPRGGPGIRDAVSRMGELLWRFMLAGTFGTIGKDVMLLGLLLIAVQLVRRGGHRPFGFARGFALAALIATSLTIKAPNIILYLFAAALLLPFFATSVRPYLGLVIAGAIAAPLVVTAVRTIDRKVFLAVDRHPDQQIVLFDLAGISVLTGTDQFATVPGWPERTLPPVARCYTPHQWDSFAPWRGGPCSGYSFAYDRLDSRLRHRWFGAILRHPIAYLDHRLTFAAHLVTTGKHGDWGAGGSALNRPDAAGATRSLQEVAARRRFARPIQPYRDTIGPLPARWIEWQLFRSPVGNRLAVFGAIPLLAFFWFRRGRGVRPGAIVPAALAGGNLLMLVFFGVSDEGRYLLPGMALFYVALLAAIAPERPRTEDEKGGGDPPIATAP
ncbi:hypothetical protein [Sphingomonas sp. VNH70]|uniref:hypothetical protein n=1 Tax=Sphingomonas silueang TaxID=3156617 RepID=UPI0032B4AA75